MDIMKTIVVAIFGSLMAACSVLPHDFDEAPVADDVSLARFYEDFLERHPFDSKSDLISFKLAMLYLKPDSEVFNVGSARTHLWQSAGRSGSPYSEGAERILNVLSELEWLRGQALLKTKKLELLAEDAARLREVARAAERRVAEQQESVGQLEQELELLRDRLGRLSGENTSQKQQIERLSEELQALKRIDVQQMP